MIIIIITIIIVYSEPFIPYQVEITAATKIGKGDNVQKTFFTNESGCYTCTLHNLIMKAMH